MAKSFKKATEGAQDIYSQIAKGGAAKATTATTDTADTKDTRDTQDTENTKTEYYRFNLKCLWSTRTTCKQRLIRQAALQRQ